MSGVSSISQTAYVLIALISLRKMQQNFLIKHTAGVSLLLKKEDAEDKTTWASTLIKYFWTCYWLFFFAMLKFYVKILP